jgi:hypothetical protein
MADGTGLDWKLKLLAWANLVIGGLGLGFGLLLVLGSLQPPYDKTVLPWVGPLFIGSSVMWFIPSLLTAWGLLSHKWWAPGIVVIGSLLLLLFIPIGTALGAFGLYSVFSQPTRLLEAGEADMRQVEFRPIDLRNLLRMGVLMVAALATLGAIVGIGYIFRDQIDPPSRQKLDTIPAMPPSVPSPRPPL